MRSETEPMQNQRILPPEAEDHYSEGREIARLFNHFAGELGGNLQILATIRTSGLQRGGHKRSSGLRRESRRAGRSANDDENITRSGISLNCSVL